MIPASRRRRDGFIRIATAQISCSQATIAKKVPWYHDSPKCRPVTAKWTPAAPRDSSARPHRMYWLSSVPGARGDTGRDVGGLAGSPSRVRSSRVINVTLLQE